MPRITVEILEGRSLDQKRALIKEICKSVTEVFKVPANGVAIHIHEVRFVDLGAGEELCWDISMREGKALYGGTSDPRITIVCVEGRSLEDKKELVRRVTEKSAEILGLQLSDIKIFINEMRRDQFAVGGRLICDK